MARKIITRGCPEEFEAILAATGSTASINVGLLVEFKRTTVSSVNYDGVQKLSAAAKAETLVAIPATEQGIAASDGVYEAGTAASDIADNPRVRFAAPKSGDRLVLKVLAGASAIVYGDDIAGVAGGTVAKGSSNIKFKALEDLDVSTGQAANSLHDLEVQVV